MTVSIVSARDRAAMYDNLRQYAWCLDRADGDGVAATFTRDGIVESSATRYFQNPGGVAEFVARR